MMQKIMGLVGVKKETDKLNRLPFASLDNF